MISILIPTYNYLISNLLEEILPQCNGLHFSYEVIISDDASSDEFTQDNLKFVEKIGNEKVQYIQQKENLGSARNRNFLRKKAQFDWLLFLDCDVVPVYSNFIENYVEKVRHSTPKVFMGNIMYHNEEKAHESLRYVYGNKYEGKRLGKSLEIGTTANFMAHKSIMSAHPFIEDLPNKYGLEDTLFFLELDKNEKQIIDNPVYHLDWESNEVYLEKNKEAMENLYALVLQKRDKLELIRLYQITKNYPMMSKFMGWLYPWLKIPLENNLKGKRPKAVALQLYKWSYFAHLQATQ